MHRSSLQNIWFHSGCAGAHLFNRNSRLVGASSVPSIAKNGEKKKSLCCDTYSITEPTLAVSETSRTPIDTEKHPHLEGE